MAQMLTGSLVRLIVTVATLAAIYFFVIRPVLDTTNTVLEAPLNSGVEIERQIGDAFDDAGLSEAKIPSVRDDGIKQARKMLACVERAGNDAAKLNACASP